MAINWLVALKAVPWTDLVQAAPAIAKGARKLFAGVRASAAQPGRGDSAGTAHAAGGSIEVRLAEMEVALGSVSEAQRSSAELIGSLAEQNAHVVQAIAILQARMRILLGVSIGLVVAFSVLIAWIALR